MQLSYKILSTLSGKAVLLSIDGMRYLFNPFEGFQRYCIEQGISICSIDVFFLPDKYAVPGLIGVYLSLGETQKDHLTILSEFPVDMECIHQFSARHPIKLTFTSEYHDERIGVKMVMAKGVSNFFIKLPTINGRFHPERVPKAIPKNMFSRLASGEQITFNGQTYDGREFCDAPIDLGTLGIIFSSGELEILDSHVKDSTSLILTDLRAAYYFGGPDRKTETFLYYILDNSFVEFCDLYVIQKMMNRKNGNFLIPCSVEGQEEQELCGALCIEDYNKEQVPRRNYIIQNQLLKSINARILQSGDEVSFCRNMRFNILENEKMAYLDNTNQRVFPSVLFLGTGCSSPSKLRNVSAIIYENGSSSFLMDCGEDTLSQIKRAYGSLSILKSLKAVFLSHSHADHILGLPSVLYYLESAITIIAPRACRQFMEKYYCNRNGNVIQHHFVETDRAKELEIDFYKMASGLTSLSEITDILPFIITHQVEEFEIKICGVTHNIDSTSISITDTKAEKKIAYTGDTLPSLLFSIISGGSDLLIHEATFTADQHKNAKRTNHSTDVEALEIADMAQAKSTVLTHFSNRNPIKECDSERAVDFYRVPL